MPFYLQTDKFQTGSFVWSRIKLIEYSQRIPHDTELQNDP